MTAADYRNDTPMEGATAPSRPLIKVVISRKHWLRGEEDSALRRSRDEKMCCVGFMCVAAGIDERKITDLGGVQSIDPSIRGKLPVDEPGPYFPLYAINDTYAGVTLRDRQEEEEEEEACFDKEVITALEDIYDVPMTEELREAEIIKHARPLGFDVEFVD